MIIKVRREENVFYSLLTFMLYFDNSIDRTDLRTGSTLSTFILLYDIFFLAFFNGVCGAFFGTCSARHTVIINFIRHCSHLLTVRSPLFPSLLHQSPHRFVRRRYLWSFAPGSATDVIHPRKYLSLFPSCAIFLWFLS
jgi:hypothetical protein